MTFLKLTFLTLLLLMVSISVSTTIKAHPGNTASDGAHYCWTRCDYWGETYGERHSHVDEYEAAVEQYEEYESLDPPEPDYEDYYSSDTLTAPTPTEPSQDNETPFVPLEEDKDYSGWIYGGLGLLGVGGYLFSIRNDL